MVGAAFQPRSAIPVQKEGIGAVNMTTKIRTNMKSLAENNHVIIGAQSNALFATTFFILFTASTWAGFIASHFLFGNPCF